MKPFTSAQLEALRTQDPGIFGQLYDAYVDQFYRFIKGHYSISDADAQDIVSDVFVKIRQALPRLDVTSSLTGWIWTIARNTIKDHFKRSGEISFSSLSYESTNEDEVSAWEDGLASPEDMIASFQTAYTFEQIQRAMTTLDDAYAIAIHMKCIEELSYEEIAKQLNTSQDTIRQRISRGLKKLTDKLQHLT